MARKPKPKTDRDIQKARQVIAKYGSVQINLMNRIDQEGLVSIFYKKLRGKSLKDISDRQLYRVAEKLYYDSFDVAKSVTSNEDGILEGIVRLGDLNDEVYELEERICIQIADLPKDHVAVRLYDRIKK